MTSLVRDITKNDFFFNQRDSKNIIWSILASKWKLESNYLIGKMWSKIAHKTSAAVKYWGSRSPDRYKEWFVSWVF